MNRKVFSSKDHDYKVLKNKFRKQSYYIALLSSIGLGLSAYALRVEIMKEKDSSYRAFCDIDSYISCSKVFNSKYGKGFGLLPENTILNQPNSVYGIIFFFIQIFLMLLQRNNLALKLKLFLSVVSNLGNCYLAYILYFVLKDFCIVCVSFYVINGILLVVNYKQAKCHSKLNDFISNKKKSN